MLKIFKILSIGGIARSKLLLTRTHMIVFEQAHTTICDRVKIDKIYLKYPLVMYVLSSGYLRDIFGINEVRKKYENNIKKHDHPTLYLSAGCKTKNKKI